MAFACKSSYITPHRSVVRADGLETEVAQRKVLPLLQHTASGTDSLRTVSSCNTQPVVQTASEGLPLLQHTASGTDSLRRASPKEHV